MAIEKKRGCGYRKVGGVYLVCPPIGMDCDRLPFELTVCPCCGAGIKFSRGFTWIEPVKLFEGDHPYHKDMINGEMAVSYGCQCLKLCPVCYPETHFVNTDGKSIKAGLLWVGEKHYSVESFSAEAGELGISKRIAAVPHGFEVGKTWVFLAHKKAIQPNAVKFLNSNDAGEDPKAAIFMAFRPQAIEKIVLQSELHIYQMYPESPPEGDPDFEVWQRLDRDVKRGFWLVGVPDDDPDHNPKAKVSDEVKDPEYLPPDEQKKLSII